MTDLLANWGQWIKPSAGLPTVQWSLLLALAAAAGHLVRRYMALPQVIGYCAVGGLAGLLGFSGVSWPLQGTALFLIELSVAVVLFETGGRIALRWFRHNPMVLLQSVLEAAFTYAAVYFTLRWFEVRPSVADAVALVAIASSPAVLSRVTADLRAAGPVTERAIVLATLGALYALTLVAARVSMLQRGDTHWVQLLQPVAIVLGVSVLAGALIALVLRVALGVMNPASENTSILLLATIAAGTALASPLGGSAPLAALLAGLMLKQFHARPWSWPRQLGTAASLVVMLGFVVVSIVAAQQPWDTALGTVVFAVIGARGAAKLAGVLLANPGSGTHWRQAVLTAGALWPMATLALLLTSQLVTAATLTGRYIDPIALPAILVLEVLGAILATFVLHQARESAADDRKDRRG